MFKKLPPPAPASGETLPITPNKFITTLIQLFFTGFPPAQACAGLHCGNDTFYMFCCRGINLIVLAATIISLYQITKESYLRPDIVL